MKWMVIIIVVVQIMFITIIHSDASGWTGEQSFDVTNRETILRIAEQMLYFKWSPVVSFTNNWGKIFNLCEIQNGIAYQ